MSEKPANATVGIDWLIAGAVLPHLLAVLRDFPLPPHPAPQAPVGEPAPLGGCPAANLRRIGARPAGNA
jgi:hypothetical protein